MRIYESGDFEQLLNLLAQSPEAAGQQIMQMMAEQKVIRQPYTFEVDFSTQGGGNALLAGQFAAPASGLTVAGSFLVDSSAPFMLVSGAYEADVAGAAKNAGNDPIPNGTVFITDQSGNRNWMNAAVPIASLFGRGFSPYYWPQPRLIPANTTISVVLGNYDAAVTANVRLSFHGWRYYQIGQ